MPAQETGKFRAARIPLDYYKKPDLLGRWNRRLLVLAILVALGATALGLLRADRGSGLVSRGPVAAVHATWDNNCDACHAPFRPVSGEAWLGHTLDPSHASSEKCTACHAGSPHHASVKAGDEADCAACHHEHRGRDASLVHVADADCTRCHGDLAAHTASGGGKGGSKEPNGNVTRFDADDRHHPEFRLPGQGQGALKFSHKVHLAPGLGAEFTLDKIDHLDPEKRGWWYREHQASKEPTALVKLGCEACHLLDKGDLPGKDGKPFGDLQRVLVPPRNAGDLMLPISYEGQCAACHPLTLDVPDPGRGGHLAVPHGLQPRDVRTFLQGHLTDQLLKGDGKLFDRPLSEVRPLPGKPRPEETETARKALADRVSRAEKTLYSDSTCKKCHELASGEKDGTGEVVVESVVPTNVPAVWYEHALFDHTSHRALSCEACHTTAADGAAKQAGLAAGADMLLPAKATCVKCHSASSASAGGARSDCAECHRYHNADHPLQGRGAARLGDTPRKFDIDDFLHPDRNAGAQETTAPTSE
jgi:hypothetical protein